jgi:hypothetical protein
MTVPGLVTVLHLQDDDDDLFEDEEDFEREEHDDDEDENDDEDEDEEDEDAEDGTWYVQPRQGRHATYLDFRVRSFYTGAVLISSFIFLL